MQTFRFRMEKVLEWYTRQYEAEERRLAVLLAVLVDAIQAIAQFQAERQTVERDVVSRESIPAPDFAALGLYRLGARQHEAELGVARDRCQADVDAQRLKLQAAQRRVRLLEKLRERRLSEHVYAETRELEELASDAFFSKWAAR